MTTRQMKPYTTLGHLFRDVYWVQCAVCGNSVSTGQVRRRPATREIVQWGWRNTRRKGWVCPTCMSKEQDVLPQKQ